MVFMQSESSKTSDKDRILHSIFEAYVTGKNPLWMIVILFIFQKKLFSICRQRQKWDIDKEELFQNIMLVFFEAIQRINPKKRSVRLSQKVLNDTTHRLHNLYRRAWNIENHEIGYGPHQIESLTCSSERINFAIIDDHRIKEAQILRLWTYTKENRTSKADYLALVETRLCGKSLTDYAREKALDYQVVKKAVSERESGYSVTKINQATNLKGIRRAE